MINYDMDGNTIQVKTITEVIADLQKVLAEHGDLPVCYLNEEYGGLELDFNQEFQMVEVPNDSEDARPEAEMHKVCAFALPLEPESHLKVIRDDE